MSKYIIPITDLRKGKIWLDVLKFDYYLFFHITETPSDTIRTHLEETYNNDITSKCRFGYYRLYGTRGNKPVVEGWALKQKGPMDMRYPASFWPVTAFEEKCIEPVQRVREFETVIVLKSDYGHPPSQCHAGWNRYDQGYMAMDISYVIYRRAKSIESGYRRSEWDYYTIPETVDVLTYLPLKGDAINGYVSNTDRVYPYTKEKHDVLRQICDMGLKLGNQLQDLFEVKKLEGKLSLDFKEGD